LKIGRFCKNWRNRSRLILSVFSKPLGESDFFLKKWFIGFGTGLPVIPTGKPVLPISLLVSADFNHCRPTDLPVLVPVYRSYRPVYRFSNFLNLKFKFEAVFDLFLSVFTITGHTVASSFRGHTGFSILGHKMK
jgi:hypothetical protein